MLMNVKCPWCGHDCRLSESALGTAVKCPACSKPFQCGTLSPRSLVTYPIVEPEADVQMTPAARVAAVRPDQIIHYCCSKCKKPLESPVNMAGQKLNCPDCGQRLQIPQPFAKRPGPSAGPVPVWSAPTAPQEAKVLPLEPAAPPPLPSPARRETCLECGVDLTGRQRVQSCPDCGTIFCSAMCFREHRYHAHPRR